MDWSTLSGRLLLIKPLRASGDAITAEVHILDGTPTVLNNVTVDTPGLVAQLSKNVGTGRVNLGRLTPDGTDWRLTIADAVDAGTAREYLYPDAS